ncbi:hypothetical protein HK104_007236, partial [Borealophlyctis nickersoniae]
MAELEFRSGGGDGKQEVEGAEWREDMDGVEHDGGESDDQETEGEGGVAREVLMRDVRETDEEFATASASYPPSLGSGERFPEGNPSSPLWTHLLPKSLVANRLTALHSQANPSYVHASTIADYRLDNPEPGVEMPTSALLGVSVLHRIRRPLAEVHPALCIRTTVMFVETPSMQVKGECSFPTGGPDRGWNWMVLRYVDSERDLFALAEEDERNQRWGRLEFRRLSDCINRSASSAQTSATPATHTHGTITSTVPTPTLVSELLIPDDLVSFSVLPHPPTRTRPYPPSNASSPTTPTHPIIPSNCSLVLAIADTNEGVILIHDHVSGALVSRSTYGTGVHTIAMYGDGLVMTGHANHSVGIWDFETGAHLVDVGKQGFGGGPVIGVSWLEEPENWACARRANGNGWVAGSRKVVKPRAYTVVSFADIAMRDEDSVTGDAGSVTSERIQSGGEFCIWDLDSAIRNAR